jgi:peptidylprolyl isomerase
MQLGAMVAKKVLKNWFAIALVLAIAVLMGLVVSPQPTLAALPSKSAIKDPRILLRNALPIDNESLRSIQGTLELMPRQANLKRWSNLSKDVETITQNLQQNRDKILAEVNPERRPSAEADITSLSNALVPLQEAITAKDRNTIKLLSEKALDYIDMLESDLVKEFPFTVPAQYANLPQLKGRALVELVTEKGNLTIVADGYSAPVNAGQFVDLVQKGFYNGLSFNRADDNYYLQAGAPSDKVDGYIDPATGKLRTVPMEVRVPNRKEPLYGKTFDELGLTGTLPVLPFAAYGTVAMAHPSSDPNGGSSQFFIYLFESELTPAGLNLLDGNFTVFGYTIEGKDVLYKLKLGDKILSARVLSGAENLVKG